MHPSVHPRILQILANHLLFERLTGADLIGSLSTRIYGLHYPESRYPWTTRRHHCRLGLIRVTGYKLDQQGWPCFWAVTDRAKILIAEAGVGSSLSNERALYFLQNPDTEDIHKLSLVR